METPSLDKLKEDLKTSEEKVKALDDKSRDYNNWVIALFFTFFGCTFMTVYSMVFIDIREGWFFAPFFIFLIPLIVTAIINDMTVIKYRVEYAHCESLKNALALNVPPTQA